MNAGLIYALPGTDFHAKSFVLSRRHAAQGKTAFGIADMNGENFAERKLLRLCSSIAFADCNPAIEWRDGTPKAW
jgi:hypothetical protein